MISVILYLYIFNFTKKLKEVQNYGIQNKQAITNPSKYGYDAQSTLMAGFKDLQGFIEQGKQATAERKAFKDYINQAIKSGKHVSDNYLDILNNAMKPVGAGYVAPDLSQVNVINMYK
jgi:competence protein ComGC